MKNIAVFASGSGTNAQAIADRFKNHTSMRIACILTNNADAFVLERAKLMKIPSLIFTREQFNTTDIILDFLSEHQINFIVLAGFLWLIPKNLINSFPKKIINIHPALLPKYGGKGMYGMRVHRTVLENKELESGITIHYVNEKYDEGNIICQVRCEVKPDDSPENLAERIHGLEHKHYPQVIEDLLMKE